MSGDGFGRRRRPEANAEARELACKTVQAGGYGGRELVIRVNGAQTQWHEKDVRAVARSGAAALMLPKVESAVQINVLDGLMKSLGAPDRMDIWCLIETPIGILKAEEIAASNERLKVILVGLADLAKDLQCAHTSSREPFIWALGHCLLAARAYGIDAIDGIHPDLEDDQGFAASCRQGRDMGYDGKTLIHPRSIDAANTIFSPSEQDLEQARTIIGAYEQALKQGAGVTVVDGKIVEIIQVETSRRLLEMDAVIKQLNN